MPNTSLAFNVVAAQWAAFPNKLQLALRDFARYPFVKCNNSYIVGYARAMREMDAITNDAYGYALSLIEEIQTNGDMRKEVLALAEQTVPLAPTLSKA